jgi:glycerol-3-phosphate cytidylyltransferase-like family protein
LGRVTQLGTIDSQFVNHVWAHDPDTTRCYRRLEGQQSIEVRDVLWNLLEDVQLDAKQRKLIWPDAERLDLEQSIQRVQQKYPDFPRNEVEEFLLDWIDMGYDPQNDSQAQLDELDSLTERSPTISKRQKPQKNRRELVTLEYVKKRCLRRK